MTSSTGAKGAHYVQVVVHHIVDLQLVVVLNAKADLVGKLAAVTQSDKEMIVLVALDLGQHLLAGVLMHLHAKVKEDDGAETAYDRADHAAHAQRIVEAVGHDRNGQNEGLGAGRTVHEVVDRVVVAYEHGKGVVAGDGQQGTHGSDGHPVVDVAEDVGDVLDSGKTKADADGIDDAVEVLVEVGVLAQHQPQGQQLERLLGERCHEERQSGGTHKVRGLAATEKDSLDDALDDAHRHDDGDAPQDGLHQLTRRLWLRVFLPDVKKQEHGGQECRGEYHESVHGAVGFS